MRLDCLGSGNAFSYGRYWSGYLLDGRILLDCPAQTLAHLFKLEVPTDEVELVLLSHQHGDHIGGIDAFLLDAMYRTLERRTRPLAIAGPPGIYDRVRQLMGGANHLPPREDPRVQWLEVVDEAFEWAGARIEAVEVDHDPAFTSVGYRVHLDGGVLGYTGDTRPCPAVHRIAEGASTLIVECGVGTYHFDWPAIEVLRGELPQTTHLLVTHYGDEPPPPEAVRGLAGVTLAEDFATYEV